MSATGLTKTRQVYLGLRDRIASGIYDTPGSLPGEQTLAAEFAVSRVTLRRALAALESDGLIERRRGAGTFLTPSGRPQPVVTDLSDVMSHLAAMGRATRVCLLACSLETPSASVQQALRLEDGECVSRSIRMRFIDDLAFSYLVACVPERIARTFTERELDEKPLLTLIERAGARVARAEQEISAVAAGAEIAHLLDVEPGAPLLALTRVTFDAEGRGLEHLRALYHPQRYSFRMDLQHGAAQTADMSDEEETALQ